MKELILVRHGQSRHHVQDITGGWTDLPLTELGYRQAKLTAQRLASKTKGRSLRILSSDLIRAAETARIIGEQIDLKPTLHPELRELNNGHAAGLTCEQAKQMSQLLKHPAIDWIPYPKAESWRMMTDRIFSFMENALPQIEHTAIVVSHGNSGIAVIQWWLQMSEQSRKAISFDLDTCSITSLTINHWNERTITKLNETAHINQQQDNTIRPQPITR